MVAFRGLIRLVQKGGGIAAVVLNERLEAVVTLPVHPTPLAIALTASGKTLIADMELYLDSDENPPSYLWKIRQAAFFPRGRRGRAQGLLSSEREG